MTNLILSMITIMHNTYIERASAIPETDTIIAQEQEYAYTNIPVTGDCYVIFYDNGTPNDVTDDIIIGFRTEA